MADCAEYRLYMDTTDGIYAGKGVPCLNAIFFWGDRMEAIKSPAGPRNPHQGGWEGVDVQDGWT